eukprot:GILJ01003383.1.p1 GENE.GILJ01003383.1~~GILJ01003383.1.p1  ORF type:complete len:120 (+),score=0.22 GILJ01003383.1:82-441(+)
MDVLIWAMFFTVCGYRLTLRPKHLFIVAAPLHQENISFSSRLISIHIDYMQVNVDYIVDSSCARFVARFWTVLLLAITDKFEKWVWPANSLFVAFEACFFYGLCLWFFSALCVFEVLVT